MCVRGAFSPAQVDLARRDRHEPWPTCRRSQSVRATATAVRSSRTSARGSASPSCATFVLTSPQQPSPRSLSATPTVRFYHDHVLTKEPAHANAQWHQD
ncbi:MAG: hypothetical protein R2713_20850 [Ilumatobacteraceae bacterium]